MIYRIYPSKDATLYEDTPRKVQNTGKDEILEIGKFYDTNNTTLLGNSRALLEFDLTSISQSIVSGDITSPQYRLRLENIENREIQSDYDLLYRMIVTHKLRGINTKANEIFGNLGNSGFSKKHSYIKRLYIEVLIRYNNNQNILSIIYIIIFRSIVNFFYRLN